MLLKRSDGAEKIDPSELRPVHIGEIKLAVSTLPKQEARQTNLAACTDDQIEIRETDGVEVIVDSRRRDLLDDCVQVRSLSDLVAHEIADCVGDLLTTAIGDRDGEREGVTVSRRLFSFPKHDHGRGRQEIEATHRLDPNATTVNRGVSG